MGVASVVNRAGLAILLVLPCLAAAAAARAQELEVLRFDVDTRAPHAEGEVHVVRVDPARWELAVLTSVRHADGRKRTLAAWGREFGLAAAVNAGMYQADDATHVGFCQVDGEVLSKGVNDYQSAFVCDPVDTVDAPFALVDLDETPLELLRRRYRTVVQNLRLIKHPGRNRWSPGRQRWREAALAQDDRGRALLILCTRPLDMHAFNELLLALPLGVVAAQHLEGSAAAGLWVRSAETGASRASTGGSPVPNVLAVRPRVKDRTP